MGSSASKASRDTVRKFPSQATQAVTKANKQNVPRPNVGASNPAPPLTESRDDGLDPSDVTGDFSRRLQQMGVVQPNPTYSPSSTAGTHGDAAPPTPLGPMFPSASNNTTLSVLEARQRLQRAAEEELEAGGQSSSQSRRFVDMRTLVDAMQLRHRGMSSADIERKLRMRPGLLHNIGNRNLISHISPN
ncbi:hypothetical protein S40288_08605 [Stachybotrys chartarum IBT 40288]|nr:hypothetical protein S40288_08605 [Stachybotrys chartarum IBT 40288]